MSKTKDAAIDAANEAKEVETSKESFAPTDEETTNEPNEDDDFKVVQSMRGEVRILEVEGETIEGILTRKKGRLIGEDELPTVELFQPSSSRLLLIPETAVIKSLLASCDKQHGTNFHFVRITYKGKRKGTNYTYNDFELAAKEASSKDLEKLATFEKENV